MDKDRRWFLWLNWSEKDEWNSSKKSTESVDFFSRFDKKNILESIEPEIDKLVQLLWEFFWLLEEKLWKNFDKFKKKNIGRRHFLKILWLWWATFSLLTINNLTSSEKTVKKELPNKNEINDILWTLIFFWSIFAWLNKNLVIKIWECFENIFSKIILNSDIQNTDLLKSYKDTSLWSIEISAINIFLLVIFILYMPNINIGNPKSDEIVKWLSLEDIIIVPIIEEVLFRYIPMKISKSIKTDNDKKYITMYWSSLIFAYCHNTNLSLYSPFKNKLEMKLNNIPFPQFILGIYCYYLCYHKWISHNILAHSINNSIPYIFI